jgi:hypothetical protein
LRGKLPIVARKGFSARAFTAKHKGKVKCAVQIGNAKNGNSARGLTKGRQAMTAKFLRLAATLTFAVATSQAVAQESTNNVANTTDWSVFVDGTPKECWGVSKPKETVNTKDGAPVSVRRGEILLFVTYRAGGAQGEISFSGGYPFAGDETPVKLEVEGQAFNLFTDGEWAWAGSPEDDAVILAALKAGGSAKVTGRSGKGTQTEDTFSLLGFSAAVDEAAKRCAS